MSQAEKPVPKAALSEIRCMRCNKLLAKMKGEIEVKCPRCAAYNFISN